MSADRESLSGSAPAEPSTSFLPDPGPGLGFRQRRAVLIPLLALGGVVVLAATWGLYLLWGIHDTQHDIYRELPEAAAAALTPDPAPEPAVVFLTPTAQRGQAASQRPGAKTRTRPGSTESKSRPEGKRGPARRPAAPAVPTPTPYLIHDWNGKQRINLLLLGLDKRGDEIPRPDSIMLASLDFKTNQAHLLSVPRDLYVNVPGFRYWKINAAYAIGENPEHSREVGGGIGLVINTLRQNFGIESIDEYAAVDFEGFIKGVDAVGGIDIRVPRKIVDPRYPEGDGYIRVVFKPGRQHMDGQTALRYARTRHAGGDFARMKRQQQVIRALLGKVRHPSIIARLPALLEIVRGHVRTSLDSDEQIRLGRWSSSLPRRSIHMHSISGPVGMTESGESVVYADWEKLNPLLRKVFGPTAGHR